MSGKPVFGIDVDGTMALYHQHFGWFAEEYVGRPLNREMYDGEYSFAKHLGIGKAKYREIKLAYRQSGLKRAMPAYPFASEMTRWLRRAGGEVIICTTRPYLHLSNIEPDLREWLKRNGIQYDDIILGEHKYRELKRGYGDRVVAVLDDLPEMVLQAQACGLTSVLREQPYNMPNNWLSVPNLEAATDRLIELMDKWRVEQ